MKPMDCDSASDSEDEISVGCPSPRNAGADEDTADGHTEEGSSGDEKLIRLMAISSSQKEDGENDEKAELEEDVAMDETLPATKNSGGGGGSGVGGVGGGGGATAGVRSFSILDILNHRPTSGSNSGTKSNCIKTEQMYPAAAAPEETPGGSPMKIVRPWDYPHLAIPHLHASGFLNPNRCLLPFGAAGLNHPAHTHHPFAGAYGLHPQALSFHPFQRAGSVGINVNVGFSSANLLSPSSGSLRASSASPFSGSSDVHDTDGDGDDFSTAGSASASPNLLRESGSRQKSLLNSGSLVHPQPPPSSSSSCHSSSGRQKNAKKSCSSAAAAAAGLPSSASSSASKTASGTNANGTPLDALFQMTSKTFEGAAGTDPSGKFHLSCISFAYNFHCICV